MSYLRSYTFIALTAILLCFVVSCSAVDAEEVKASDVPKATPVKNVQVVKPVAKNLSVTVDVGVTLAPEEIGNVSAEITAVLNSWNVEENQKVKKGDIIAKLDPIDYQINLEQAKANYEGVKAQFASVEKDYYRMKSLVESGNIPQQQFDSIEGQYKAMKNQLTAMENGLRLIQRKVAKSNVRAPYDGIVSRKLVPLGKFIMITIPGSGDIATIEKVDRLKASLNISEMFFNEIDSGAKIDFFIPSLNQKVTSTIESKGKSINALKQFNIISYLDNKNNKIPAGVYAMANIRTEEKKRIIVPATAVNNLGNRIGEVYSIKDGIVKANKVVVGFPFDEGVEVSGDVPKMVIKDISSVRVGEKVKAFGQK